MSMASKNYIKDYDYQLGKITQHLAGIETKQAEMHMDIREIRDSLADVKSDTKQNTEYRKAHTKAHIYLEKRVGKLENFKARVYGVVAGISMLFGATGSMLIAFLKGGRIL